MLVEPPHCLNSSCHVTRPSLPEFRVCWYPVMVLGELTDWPPPEAPLPLPEPLPLLPPALLEGGTYWLVVVLTPPVVTVVTITLEPFE